MSKAAKKSTLEQLHDAVATHLLSVLQNADAVCAECKRSKVDPRVLATAVKFVKENDIEADQDADGREAPGFRPRVDVAEDLSTNE